MESKSHHDKFEFRDHNVLAIELRQVVRQPLAGYTSIQLHF